MKKFLSVLLCSVLIFAFCVGSVAADKPYDDSEFYVCGDYSLHYRVIEHTGEFKGRIAMLHGFVCSTYAWRNMAAGFSAAGYDCLLIDLPNFGYSTRETAAVKHIDREELVIGLMKTIAPMNEWILAGHSMGGGVAINIAEAEQVKALLLYCPAPQGTAPDSLSPLLTSRPMCAAMDMFFDVGLRIKPLVRAIIYFANFNREFAMNYDLSGVTAPLMNSNSGTGMCNMLFRVRATDLENTDKITAPVLLTQADKDVILSSSMKEQMDSAFPDAERHSVSGGHQCIEDMADELVPTALRFLEK